MAIAKSTLDIINIDESDAEAGRETTIKFLGFSDGENDISDVYSGIGGTTQSTGSGQNDVTFGGTFTGTSATTYYVKIDATGTPDTFSWSKDNFSTTEATGVSFIDATPITLDNGITVTATSSAGHTLNDVWEMTTIVDITAPHELAKMVVNHQGTSADDKGEMIIRTNDGGVVGTATAVGTPTLDDMTSSGTYTGGPDPVTYYVKVTVASGTDEFAWSTDDSTYSSSIAMTGSAQTIEKGIQVTFAATTGHAVDDKWTITVGSNAVIVHANGDVTFSGTIVETSSKTLKMNISPIENSLSKIISLQGVNFNWKNKPGTDKDVGLIAEDVFAIAPEYVSVVDNKPVALKYSKMVSLLIEGMKEQQAQIEDLKAEIKTLKN